MNVPVASRSLDRRAPRRGSEYAYVDQIAKAAKGFVRPSVRCDEQGVLRGFRREDSLAMHTEATADSMIESTAGTSSPSGQCGRSWISTGRGRSGHFNGRR